MLKKEVIYQIFPQTFNDGLNSGSGNLKGITNKIEYLKWLGITRIWISPFCTSPFKDSGYDVQNYYEIDSRFGDMNDFEELVKKAKDNGIEIIMDMVFNHSSTKHEWFKKASKGEKKYMDYYIFKDPIDDKEPTNWKSKMGGSCWEYLPNLNKYYLHLFAKEQADLNWKNPDVQKEIINILNFWKEKGVTGFRLDVCNLYDKPDIYENDYIGDGRRFYTDGDKVNDYFRFMNENVFSKINNCITLGEISSTTKEKSVQYSKKENEELYSLFTFWHLKVDYFNNNKWTVMEPDLIKMNEIFKEWQLYFQENNADLSLFLNNHDQPRSVSRFGNDKQFWKESSKTLFAYVFFMKGTPVIYQGEEIGMTNLHFNELNEFWDVESIGNAKDLKILGKTDKEILEILNQKSRDNARSAMQWNSQPNAGFTSAKQTKIFVNKNYKKINVEEQIKDDNSILNFYRKMINLRKENDAFNSGKITFINDQKYFGYSRIKDEEFIVLSNWSNNIEKIKEDLSSYNELITTYDLFGEKLILRPWETKIFKKRG